MHTTRCLVDYLPATWSGMTWFGCLFVFFFIGFQGIQIQTSNRLCLEGILEVFE